MHPGPQVMIGSMGISLPLVNMACVRKGNNKVLVHELLPGEMVVWRPLWCAPP